MKMSKFLAAALAGLGLRIALAALSGHPYDMTLWAYSLRELFGQKVIDLVNFPTLPLLYYIQVIFYAPYVLLRLAGLPDTVFLYHTTFIIEGIFIRLPFILGDLGIFVLLNKLTRNLRFALLFYFNPLVILVSAAWGMYDSVMILALLVGYHFRKAGRVNTSALFFAVSGLVKLLGFVPLLPMILEDMFSHRIRQGITEAGISLATSGFVIAPLFLYGGLRDFFVGFVLRLAGLSGAQTRTYNLFASLTGASFSGSSPLIWLTPLVILGSYLVVRGKYGQTDALLLSTVSFSLFAMVASQAQPEWLYWLVPLGILLARARGIKGLGEFTFVFGTASSFLTITLIQGTAYLATGVPGSILPYIEGLRNGLAIYSVTVMSLLLAYFVFLIGHPRAGKVAALSSLVVYMAAYVVFAA